MKNMIITVGFAVTFFSLTAKDPVIMTVNGVDVPRSEFEYLYHKNRTQQLEPQSLEEYVEMFKLYKLKVADAKACGFDTISSFRQEMQQYRKELAAPYLTDSVFLNSLVEEAAHRLHEEVETSHIMVMKDKNSSQNLKNRQLIDSIRGLAVSGKDFGELAVRYSADVSARRNKGNLGFISYGRYPYDFETVAYNTPKGEISEIVESPVGYHIIKTGERRPAQGKVRVSHIMKLIPRDASDNDVAKVKSEIDSIYDIVISDPSKFSDLAIKLSDDKGSARHGGELPAFGTGEMVPEFETTAYNLNPGEISHPFRSVYGWHIVKKIEDVAFPTADQIRSEVMRAVANPRDDRYRLVSENQMQKLAARHNAKLDLEVLECINKSLLNDSLEDFIANNSSQHIAVVDHNEIPVSEFIEFINNSRYPDVTSENLKDIAEAFFSSRLLSAEEERLYSEVSDYRNLLNEYHDGTLLYNVSLEKVWDKASKDTVGLENYFNSHRSDYKWDAPRVKGFLIQVTNDSVAGVIKTRLKDVPDQQVVSLVRKEFPGVAQIERILLPKGANPMVDNIMFGGPVVSPQIAKFTSYFLHAPRVLNSPEDIGDVRGRVITDYQMELESEWVKQLKQKYPVKINKKELKKVK